MKQGNIDNPHTFEAGGAFRSQLYHCPLSLAQLSQQRQQCNTSSPETFFDNFVEHDIDSDGDTEQDRNDNHNSHSNVNNTNTIDPISLLDDHLLPSKYVEAINRYNSIKHRKPLNSKAPQRFQYNNTLGCRDTALLELLKICDKHEANKAMFEDILDWVTACQTRLSLDSSSYMPRPRNGQGVHS